MSHARQQARLIAGAGVVLFWVVLLGLQLIAGLPLLDSILLAVLLAAVPTLSLAQVPLIDGVPIERLPAYLSSIMTLWLLGTACWLVGTRADGAAAVGVVWISPVALLAWSLGLTVAGMLIIVGFRWIGSRVGALETDLLRNLLPRTPRERRVFGVLSLAAGTGEELAYRGYAIPVLAPLLGVTGAAVVTTVVFGVMHGYQGPLGMVRTSLMGGVLAAGFLASGSVLPAILAHTAIDLLAGIVFGERLLSPAAAPGV